MILLMNQADQGCGSGQPKIHNFNRQLSLSTIYRK